MNEVDILIVDDREDGLTTLEAVLNMPGVNLVKAQSGREALAWLDHYDFGVILLDVQMPEMDGFETARHIRRHERYKLTPIIFVTAINKDDEYIYRGYEAGAVDYIFKPFEPQILRSKVNIFIDLFLKSRQLQAQTEIIRESERRERYLRLAELEVESLKRYRSLADAIPHMIWRAKSDGSLDYFNNGWIDYTGFSLEKSFGSGWQAAIYPDDLKSFLKAWMSAMSDGHTFELECRILNKDGSYRWFWIKAVAEVNPSSHITSWLGTCTDIHDRKLAENKIIEAEREAKAANAAKTNFLANMSHEIRTPMNAILGFTELMLDTEQTLPERLKCVHTVQRNGNQLLKLIDEILDISKVEAGRLQIERIDVNLGNLLFDMHSLFELQAQDKNLDFKIHLDNLVPRWVVADPTRMRQILMNLMGNAIKFTKKGFVHLNVSWSAKNLGSESGRLRFVIADSGVGIDPAHASKLFQPFVQEDCSTTRNFGGTGLGLALSKKLAQAMDGDVILEKSSPGVGAEFCFELQLSSLVSTDYISNLDLLDEARVRKKSKKIERRLQNLNILLVEDVPDNQTLMGRFLGMAGAHVDIASNGEEGVAKAMSGRHDVVLMDIQMPILDGYQATRRLRELGYKSPIIALTAHALNEEREKSFEIGFDDHLAKPVEFGSLIERLLNVLPPAKSEVEHHV